MLQSKDVPEQRRGMPRTARQHPPDAPASTPAVRIKVAFVIDALDPRAGGTETQLLQLLRRLDRRRFEPKVFCLRSTARQADDPQAARATVLGLRVGRSPSLIPRLWSFARRLRRERFDIVQTHFRDGNLVGVVAGWLAGTGVIVSTRRGEPYWSSRLELALLRWLDRRVTWFAANSQAAQVRSLREEGVDPARIGVIYNGLDPQQFRAGGPIDRDAVRSELGLAPDELVVGIVANFRPVKGLPDFLHAAALVAQRFPCARFVVVGEGEQGAQLRRLGDQLGLRERVLWLGSRGDVPRLLQAFDVGVLASHSESFANAILEYLAAGLPVVVTDVGDVRQVVREGRNGFIVPPHNPHQMAGRIGRLLDCPSGPRGWRSDTGLEAAFHVDAMVASYERLYTQLVAERSGAPRVVPPAMPELRPAGPLGPPPFRRRDAGHAAEPSVPVSARR